MGKSIGEPAISVIVPVYNAEAYLEKSINSLLAQTFKDFELLLVDDGSTDASGELCDAFAQADTRVRVFHKTNEGVSATRQFGLEQARGEYTIHADPDDWVEPDMLEKLYTKAKAEDADMVICDYYVEFGKKTELKRQQPSALDSETVLREMFQRLHGSLCNKLVKRTCYKDFQISFPPEIHYSEDLYVVVSLLLHPIKVAYIPRAFYHYNQTANPNSISRSAGKRTYEWFVAANERISSLLDEKRFATEKEKIRASIAFMALRTNYYPPSEFKHLFRGAEKGVQSLSGWKRLVTSGALHVNYNLFRRILQLLYLLRTLFLGVGKA